MITEMMVPNSFLSRSFGRLVTGIQFLCSLVRGNLPELAGLTDVRPAGWTGEQRHASSSDEDCYQQSQRPARRSVLSTNFTMFLIDANATDLL